MNLDFFVPSHKELISIHLFARVQPNGSIKIGDAVNSTIMKGFPKELAVEDDTYTFYKVEKDIGNNIVWGIYIQPDNPHSTKYIDSLYTLEESEVEDTKYYPLPMEIAGFDIIGYRNKNNMLALGDGTIISDDFPQDVYVSGAIYTLEDTILFKDKFDLKPDDEDYNLEYGLYV